MNKIYLIIGLMFITTIFTGCVEEPTGNNLYYNLTTYSDDENIIDFYNTTDTLLQGFFSLFLVMIVMVISTILMIKSGQDQGDAILLGSLYGLLLSIFLYISKAMSSNINKPGMYIFIPALIFSVTLAVKWYNKR